MEVNLAQCHLAHQKARVNILGIKPGPPVALIRHSSMQSVRKAIIPNASDCRMTLETNSHHRLNAEYGWHSFFNAISAVNCQERVLETWQGIPKDGYVRQDQKQTVPKEMLKPAVLYHLRFQNKVNEQ